MCTNPDCNVATAMRTFAADAAQDWCRRAAPSAPSEWKVATEDAEDDLRRELSAFLAQWSKDKFIVRTPNGIRLLIRCRSMIETLAGELERLLTEQEALAWNLGGCGALALGYHVNDELAHDSARPALLDVQKMARQLAEYRADAERYRYIRNHMKSEFRVTGTLPSDNTDDTEHIWFAGLVPEYLDRAIDAARGASTKEVDHG